MKKCILLVGRDEILWDEFNAYAAHPAATWIPHFARQGQEALRLCETQQFAAVLSQSKLPDMAGVAFLDEVMARQPRAMRFVLSEASDARGTVECMGRAHHHLFKPCTVETLETALARVAAERWSPSEALKSVTTSFRQAPSPPMIYFQVVSEMQSKNASLERVAELVSQDPAMTAKILQLANSAVFSLQLRVNDPLEAISYVGLETTKALVLMSHTFSTFHELRMAGFSVDQLWSHSVLAGSFAKRIAQMETDDQSAIEEAFTAGLLHDFGKLLIAANAPDRFGAILECAAKDQCSFADAEAKIYTGFGHAEIGACLLGIWWLPQRIVEAVAFHHHPSQIVGEGFHPMTAVHAADILAHEALPDRCGMQSPPLDLPYLQAVGAEARWAEWHKQCLAPQQRHAA